MALIEALYIFDENKATPAAVLLPLYLAQPTPRPALTYLPSTNPPTLVHAILQDNLLYICPSSQDTEPLAIVEFLHRVTDALQEFLGSPLLASKITSNYDIVAQIITEIADGGLPCQSEANALRDVVETGPGVLNNLLENLGIQGSAPTLSSAHGASSSILQRSQTQSSQGLSIPWRRSNVRHTSNEMYVDIVEEVSAILAPSGRPLSAFANGSIAFTSKVSGVPDILLTLSTGGKGVGMGNRGQQLRNMMDHVVFHPCVRLGRWKNDGVMSFIPPDGRFSLCGYEVDLLGDIPLTNSSLTSLSLPASVEITTSLGQAGNEFEVRLSLSSIYSAKSPAQASLQSHLGSSRPTTFRAASSGGDSKFPAIEKLAVRLPLPQKVRNVSELRASTGEAHWSPVDDSVEWSLSAKDMQVIDPATTLRCTVQGPLDDKDDSNNGTIMNGLSSSTYDYDDEPGYQTDKVPETNGSTRESSPQRGRAERNRALMPTSALLSFSIKGWLASGLKVESLLLDNKNSRGIGAEVKPYKGVKYLTVSREGIEARC